MWTCNNFPNMELNKEEGGARDDKKTYSLDIQHGTLHSGIFGIHIGPVQSYFFRMHFISFYVERLK